MISPENTLIELSKSDSSRQPQSYLGQPNAKKHQNCPHYSALPERGERFLYTSTPSYESLLRENRALCITIQEFLENKGYKIIDYSDDRVHLSLGINFEIYNTKKKAIFRVGVISDSKIHKSGNIFVEHKIERFTKEMSKGYLHYCLADVLCYFDAIGGAVYMLDWAKLREISPGYPLVSSKSIADYKATVHGYIVPLAEAKRHGCIMLTFSLR